MLKPALIDSIIILPMSEPSLFGEVVSIPDTLRGWLPTIEDP